MKVIHYHLINHDKRFVVVVSPKCGCTSVKDWFNNSLAKPHDDINAHIHDHMITAEALADLDGYLKIFVIRNPLHRLVSFYYQWVVNLPNVWSFADHDRSVDLHGHTFRQFMMELERLAERGSTFQHHLVPQTHRRLGIRFDHVIKLEDLNERLDPISRALGIDYRLQHLNRLDYSVSNRAGAFNLPPAALRDRPAYSFRSFFDYELFVLARKLYLNDVRYYEAA